jgi:hypothetical protein
MSIRDATPFRCGRQGDVSGLDAVTSRVQRHAQQTADSTGIFVAELRYSTWPSYRIGQPLSGPHDVHRPPQMGNATMIERV